MGYLSVLKWARGLECDWDEWTCVNAAQNGHFSYGNHCKNVYKQNLFTHHYNVFTHLCIMMVHLFTMFAHHHNEKCASFLCDGAPFYKNGV